MNGLIPSNKWYLMQITRVNKPYSATHAVMLNFSSSVLYQKQDGDITCSEHDK